LQWHSADYIQWVPVEPSTAGPFDLPGPPSEIKYQVDELPPSSCLEQDEHACGIWFSLDSGRVWGLGAGVQGGDTVPDWASADGVNWERVAHDATWYAIEDGMGASHIRDLRWEDWRGGVGFSGGSAGNVAIFAVTLRSDNPHDTPAPTWYWVTQLP
jgi:hypothetical protein